MTKLKLNITKARGIGVEAILDRRDLRAGHEAVSLLASSSIPIFVDQAVRIAHSKITIIDAKEIITGSFNFTNAAELYNSENLLILKNDPALLLKYLKNYQQRHDQSRVLSNESTQRTTFSRRWKLSRPRDRSTFSARPHPAWDWTA